MRRMLLAAAAALALSPALAVGPENPRLQMEPEYRDAVRHIKAEEFAKAIPILFKLDKAYPNEPEVLNWLGFTHRKLKDYPKAKHFYDAALKIEPYYRPALEYQGMWFIETGDIPSAKANLAKLRQICAACEETKDLEEALKKAGH
ncbi:MAG: tetratricopeptide repeat protein [Beijerinckiaceae bacterium]